MANKEHLEILKQGTATWNSWRRKNSDTQPDLRGADLSLADLREAYLCQVDLREANLSRADLTGAQLRKANLSNAELRGASLKQADLKGADLRGANLSGYTDLRESAINESTQFDEKWLLVWEILNKTAVGRELVGVDLSRANLSKVALSQANLSRADLSRANLSEADLGWANLSRANLSRAYLSQANLVGANLSQADLSEADARWANLSEARLKGTNFILTNLSRANLQKADLSGADLSDAKLFKALLRDADLTRASLVRTDLQGADLSGCQVYGISVWDLNLEATVQRDLKLGLPEEVSSVIVDEIEVAQFVYLVLKNKSIKKMVDFTGRRGVLILGRFPGKRKRVLDAIRRELRRRGFIPLMFESDKPGNGKLTDIMRTLARLSRFVIADFTGARNLPWELQSFVPLLPDLPVCPIILESQYNHALLQGLLEYHWVLPPYRYHNREQLITSLAEKVISPVERKAIEIAERRQKIGVLMAKEGFHYSTTAD